MYRKMELINFDVAACDFMRFWYARKHCEREIYKSFEHFFRKAIENVCGCVEKQFCA